MYTKKYSEFIQNYDMVLETRTYRFHDRNALEFPIKCTVIFSFILRTILIITIINEDGFCFRFFFPQMSCNQIVKKCQYTAIVPI